MPAIPEVEAKTSANIDTISGITLSERGKAIFYGDGTVNCSTCHTAGMHNAPHLIGFSHRKTIAGTLPNTPDNLRKWLTDPQSVKPSTEMATHILPIHPDPIKKFIKIPDAEITALIAYLQTL